MGKRVRRKRFSISLKPALFEVLEELAKRKGTTKSKASMTSMVQE